MDICACYGTVRIICNQIWDERQRERLTLVTLWTYTKTSKLFAFSLPSEVKGMCKLARLALLTQPSLVMLADQMTDTRSLVRWSVVPVWTCGTARTVSFSKVFADWAIEFGRISKVVCVLEEWQE